jgi:hypothetical protein
LLDADRFAFRTIAAAAPNSSAAFEALPLDGVTAPEEEEVESVVERAADTVRVSRERRTRCEVGGDGEEEKKDGEGEEERFMAECEYVEFSDVVCRRNDRTGAARAAEAAEEEATLDAAAGWSG